MVKTFLSALGLGAASAVFAQMQPVYSQPYNATEYGLSAYESRRVVGPPGFGWRAYDDFNFQPFASVRTVVWYGRVANPKQLWPTRWWWITLYPDSNCSVGAEGYQRRVRASHRRVGVDCEGYTVYRFQASFYFVGFGRSWLSIAEDDATSATPGKPDFFWSGYQSIRGCEATQTNRINWRSLFDACDRGRTDLAFELFAD